MADGIAAGSRAPQAPDLPATAFRFTWHFITEYRGWYSLILLLQIGTAASSIAVPYALGAIIRAVSNSGFAALKGPALLFVGLGIAEMICARGAGRAQLHVSPRLRQRVTNELFAYIQHHSHRYFSDRFAGALAHRIAETSTGVAQTLWAISADFLPIAVKITVAVGLLMSADWRLSAFVTAWAAIFIVVAYALARRCQPLSHQYAATRSATTAQIVDTITNVSSVRLFARLGDERRRLNDILNKEVATADIAFRFMDRIRSFQHGAAFVLKIGALGGALWLWRIGAIDAGAFIMCTSIALLIIAEAGNLGRRFLDFFEYLGNVENGVTTLIRPHEFVDSAQAVRAAIHHGRIEFRDVAFGYRDGVRVFNGVSVTISAGQHVGLVGYSGSGKSTFVNLLLRLYDPQQGAILIDGVDLRSMTLESLHAQIGVIPQEPGLFHRSLADNIRYGKPQATDEEVENAARGADAHAFITDMPQGYEALVGERGVKLSGGQRQRIAIARVLLKDAPILVLDEATASLDSVTEHAIQTTLDDVMRGKSVIVVAHRLSTIAHLDRILVFDAGKIVEDGSHAELLARRGIYHRLWTQQVDGFLPEHEAEEGVPVEVNR